MTYLESAIIGYWRQGAMITEITWITGLEWDDIYKILTNYFKDNKLW